MVRPVRRAEGGAAAGGADDGAGGAGWAAGHSVLATPRPPEVPAPARMSWAERLGSSPRRGAAGGGARGGLLPAVLAWLAPCLGCLSGGEDGGPDGLAAPLLRGGGGARGAPAPGGAGAGGGDRWNLSSAFGSDTGGDLGHPPSDSDDEDDEDDLLSAEVFISCCDGVGLGCEIARVLLEFGLSIERGDFSTDGRFSFLMFKVAPLHGAISSVQDRGSPDWELLETMLARTCPMKNFWKPLDGKNWYIPQRQRQLYVLSVEARDEVGLLLKIMKTITVNDFVLFRIDCHTGEEGAEAEEAAAARVPGGTPEPPSSQKTVARDKFYISDNRFDPGRAETVDEASSEARVRGLAREIAAITGGRCDFHARERRAKVIEPLECLGAQRLPVFSGMVRAENAQQGFLAHDALRAPTRSTSEEWYDGPVSPPTRSISARGDVSRFLGSGFTLEIDNYTSELHTVVYMTAVDRKGAFYDLMRSLKDVELNVSYGKIEASSEVCQFTLFVSTDGGKITCARTLQQLESLIRRTNSAPFAVHLTDLDDGRRLKLELDTWVDGNGRGRPRVIYDTVVTLSGLKDLPGGGGAISIQDAEMIVKTRDRGLESGGLLALEDSEDVYRTDPEKQITIEKQFLEERHTFYLRHTDGAPICEPAKKERIRRAIIAGLIGVDLDESLPLRSPLPSPG